MTARAEVAVVYNQDGALAAGSAEDSVAVASVEAAARGIADALASRGWSARAIAAPSRARDVPAFVAGLDCDVVFNQVESIAGDARAEAHFAAALELRGLRYTGSRPLALSLCLHKPLARAVLASEGLPIARGALLATGSESLAGLSFPLIVKPSREDASHGVSLDSVVHDEAGARSQARAVIERYAQPALVEEYIDGREINVGLLGGEDPEGPPRLVGVSEIVFSDFPAGAPRIVTYGGKWIEGSVEWNGTRSVPADLEPARARAVVEAACGAWRALGLSGYARVDLRVEPGERGRLAVIDVNPNPDISPEAGFALTAQRGGASYADFIESILQLALRREPARA